MSSKQSRDARPTRLTLAYGELALTAAANAARTLLQQGQLDAALAQMVMEALTTAGGTLDFAWKALQSTIAHSNGARKANASKRKAKLDRDAERYARFQALLAAELQKRQPDRTAHANAVRQLAAELVVEPEQVRRFLRQYEKTRAE